MTASRRVPTGLVLALVLAGTVTLTPGLAQGQQAPPPELTVTPTAAAPGATVIAHGSGFEATGQLTLFLDQVAPANALATMPLVASTFELEFVVPEVPAGAYRVIACRDPQPTGQCRQVVRTDFDVLRASPTTSSSTTSSSTTPPTTPPPTVPAGPDVEGGPSTTATTVVPGGVAAPPTTLDGSPPAPTGPGSVGADIVPTIPGIGQQLGGVDLGDIPNLSIHTVEVTQGLQNLDNDFPLVRNRRTVLRVYGRTEGPGDQGSVGAAVAGFRITPDGEVPLGIEFSENVVTVNEEWLNRSTHAHTPYIELPPSWAQGTVKLRVWIFAGQVLAENEPDTTDNLLELTVKFHDGEPVHLWYWPLYLTEGYDPDGDPLIWTVNDGFLAEHLFTYRLWPVMALVPHLMFDVIGDETSDWDLDERPGEPNVVMKEMWHQAQLDGLHQYVGMVHSDFELITTFGGLAGGGGGVASWTIMGLESSRPWFHRSGATLAHEGGHAFGLLHAPCAWDGTALPGETKGGAVDPSFPGDYGWPDCSLAPTDLEGYYGLDVNWELGNETGPTILSNHPTVANAAFPLMGYWGPQWLDPWHGCYLIDVFGVPCVQQEAFPVDTSGPNQGSIPPVASGGVPAFNCDENPFSEVDFCQLAPNPSGDPTAAPEPGGTEHTDDWEEHWIISGWVDPTTGTGHLLRALTLPEDPNKPVLGPTEGLTGDPHGGGPYVLALVDDDATALWAATLELHYDSAPGAAQHWFVERVPRIPEATRILLTSSAGDLSELAASPNPPEVSVSAAVGEHEFEYTILAADADGGDVWTSASYRATPDDPWTPITPLSTQTDVAIDLRGLSGSDAGELLVRATDGFHTTTTIVTGLQIPNQAPVVTMITPTTERSRPAGRTLALRATAWDNEDGILDGDQVEWSSDRDGALGTGSAADGHDLSEGVHLITAAATDLDGARTEATVEVVIGPTDLPSVDDRAALLALLSGSDDVGGSGYWSLTRLGVAGFGALAAAAAVLVFRRRKGTL